MVCDEGAGVDGSFGHHSNGWFHACLLTANIAESEFARPHAVDVEGEIRLGRDSDHDEATAGGQHSHRLIDACGIAGAFEDAVQPERFLFEDGIDHWFVGVAGPVGATCLGGG